MLEKIKELDLKQVEARIAELDSLAETSESAEEIKNAQEERALLVERQSELKDLEERKATAQALTDGKIQPTAVVESRKEERTMLKVEEYRNSKEYIDAYAQYIKTGKDEECRALLTQNVGDAGQVAVPDLVYEVVQTDWLKSEVMALVKKISVKGNYRVQFELSAGDAVIHNEGSGAVSEEELTLGVVTLIPESIKKWISVSDEVLDMTGEAFLRYIYDELTYKIMAKAEEVLINKIKSLPETATATSVSAKKVKAGADVTTIITAKGKLNAEAKNIVAVMSPGTQAAFESSSVGKNFAMDPFRGVKVITTNALPDIDVATENQVYAIIGDFGYGALANFPAGDSVEIKIDDKGKMKSDLVDILGREFIAVEPIANRAFVNITKPAAI